MGSKAGRFLGLKERVETAAKPIWITEHDKERLTGLIAGLNEAERTEEVRRLEARLEGARAVGSRQIPEDVVTMNCLVRLLDRETSVETEHWLRFSTDAGPSSSRAVLVLSDLGMALLGSREGDLIEWSTPSGCRRSKIVEIVYQPERLGNFKL